MDNLEQKINRRSFLKKAVSALGGIALAGYIGLGIGCKGGSPSGPTTPVQVTLQFDAFNHTQGFRSSLSKNVLSDSSVTIKVSDFSASDVDPNRIAIRERNSGGKVGNYVQYSNTGAATFSAPSQSMGYDVILFNTSNGAPYDWMDAQNSSLYKGKRNYVVYRQDRDGLTGPESAWGGEPIPEIGNNYGVFDQLNSALKPTAIPFSYGSIDRRPSAGSGDFSYGFGLCYGADGWHAGTWIAVNPTKSNTMGQVAVGLEEAFENITGTQNIGGHSSLTIIQYQGIFNPVGQDLICYTSAKDQAGASTSRAKFSFGFM
jgi:hypothetical protein